MRAKILFAIGLSSIPWPAIARACSVCLSGDDDAVTHAFNWSVAFLLSAPYVIAGSIGMCLIIAYRRAAVKRAALEASQAISQLNWMQEESKK